MEQSKRNSSHSDFVGDCSVYATHLDGDWQVGLSLRLKGDTGSVSHYVSAKQARALAAALIRAADHYDAETARLTQQEAK